MDDFVLSLEQFENGNGELNARDQDWYDAMDHCIQTKGELSLRNQLEDFYDEYAKNQSSKVIRLWSAVGIAAMLVIGGVYLTVVNSSTNPIQLQINDAPVFSDSASYDTIQNHKKNSENHVD